MTASRPGGDGIVLGTTAACRLALRTQLMDGRARLPRGKEGVARTIAHLGYLQIDTISVVERAHHHTLRARRADYRHAHLHELQSSDRRIFEYWGHAASFLPIEDYRYYLPRMRSYLKPTGKWEKERTRRVRHLLKPVLERIRNEGPLASRDFEPPKDSKRGPWWDWKPAKVALELLFWRGDLMITERRSFQRVYDLTERVLPGDVDTRIPDDDELGRFLVRRALDAYGVAREPEIRNHIHAAGRLVIARGLRDLVDAGEVAELRLEHDPAAVYYARPDALARASRLRAPERTVRILSPFDNLVIQRDRLRRIFDFDYTLECFVPAAKRLYGYFVLPVLWGERFAARFDPHADRKTGTFTVRNLVLEPDLDDSGAFLDAFADALAAFADFNRCPRIVIDRVSPGRARAALRRALRESSRS